MQPSPGGVRPLRSAALWSTPLFSRRRATSRWPLLDAMQRGVEPSKRTVWIGFWIESLEKVLHLAVLYWIYEICEKTPIIQENADAIKNVGFTKKKAIRGSPTYIYILYIITSTGIIRKREYGWNFWGSFWGGLTKPRIYAHDSY